MDYQLKFFEDFNVNVSTKTKDTPCSCNNRITLESKVIKDEYTEYIQNAFDLKVGDVSQVSIPNKLDLGGMKDWNIGVICGASGSGKSTILKSIGDIYHPTFDDDKCLISNFDMMPPKEATILLSAMGLASVPTWIRPYKVLSNGEKYRADLAMTLATHKNGVILIDEYTSVVDRNVAKSMSNALQKYVRRNNIKIILASCHYDIFDWLQPDWIYDLNKGGALEKGDCLRQRPKIELQMYRTTCDTWRYFRKYHYMTQELNQSSSCFVFCWNNNLVAFVATLPLPSGTIKNAIRGHRTVVLPDFQGMGIGSIITSFMGGIYKSIGCSYYTKTVNPSLGEYRNKHNELWEGTMFNGKYRKDNETYIDKHGHKYLPRISYCHKYVGNPIYGYEHLLKPIDQMRWDKSNEGQLSLF